MKYLFITIAAVVLVGCGESQQSVPAPESKPEAPTAKAPDISIHKAAEDGNIETIKQHLAAGTDVNVKDGSGKTPLYIASIADHEEIVKFLIAKGADVNAKEDWNFTPLEQAVTRGHKKIAELLIAEGVDVNAKNDIGDSLLHNAMLWPSIQHTEIIKVLIANGADVNAKDDDGDTPLDYAHRRKYTEGAALLRKHGGKTGEELKAAGN